MKPMELVHLGIAYRCVLDASLDEAVEECLAWLTDKSRNCLGTVKRQMMMTAAAPASEAINIEREIFLAYVTPENSDAQDGFRSWREDRQPKWANRVTTESGNS